MNKHVLVAAGVLIISIVIVANVTWARTNDFSKTPQKTLRGFEQTCIACHGVNGRRGSADGVPRLASDPKRYLIQQLDEFADKKRQNALMSEIVKNLTPKQIVVIATYFSQIHFLSTVPARRIRLLHISKFKRRWVIGKEIVNHGLWAKAVPRCEACHGPGNTGFFNTPSLAGQSAKYLQAQLQAFKDGRRPGGVDGVMSHIARSLTVQQIKAVSFYLSILPDNSKYKTPARFTLAPSIPDVAKGFFQPPLEKEAPTGEFGQSVRFGYLIFTHTPLFARNYVGDNLSCTNCHVDGGRRPYSAPMWAAWGIYPKYRRKNHKINDMGMRIQGCFRFSENGSQSTSGHVPALNSKVMIALKSYIKWLATNAPAGVKLKGQGYAHIPPPRKRFSITRGKVVYANRCAACHGIHGEGRQNIFGQTVFPPLWGPNSFNLGAGMHNVKTAAAFIDKNMPFGHPGILTLQQAWDAAAYMDSRPRPPNPKRVANDARAKKY